MNIVYLEVRALHPWDEGVDEAARVLALDAVVGIVQVL